MLSRIKARIITLGSQNIARLLGDSLKHLGSYNSSNIYVKATEYLNSLISVLILTIKDIGNERKDLQMHQTI